MAQRVIQLSLSFLNSSASLSQITMGVVVTDQGRHARPRGRKTNTTKNTTSNTRKWGTFHNKKGGYCGSHRHHATQGREREQRRLERHGAFPRPPTVMPDGSVPGPRRPPPTPQA